MKLSELMGEKAGRLADVEITGVTCDSRHVGPGNAFVCIRGTAADGHKFAEAAVAAGASKNVNKKVEIKRICWE